MMNKPTTIRIHPEVLRLFGAICRLERRSVSGAVEDLMQAHIAQYGQDMPLDGMENAMVGYIKKKTELFNNER